MRTSSKAEDSFKYADNEEDESEVDMSKTMWLVLRKTVPQNQTLKKFYTQPAAFEVKLYDIIKFGRVNFRISVLNCTRLKRDAQVETKVNDGQIVNT